MIFILLVLFALICYGMEISPENKFVKDYMSIEKTASIKGIFVILILFSHYSQYVVLSGGYDEPYLNLQKYLSQLVVVMFLFYSGYGIMESIKKKRFLYVKNIMSSRFVKVLVNFDIAVLLYLLVAWILGKEYSIFDVCLALIGWGSVGNSNWYIFVTLVLYVIVFVAFYGLRWRDNKWTIYIGAICTIIFSVAYVYWMMKIGRPTRYYNTMILFAVGMWYSLLKEKIDRALMKNDYIYTCFSIVVLVVYFYSYTIRWEKGIEGYTIWAVTFTLVIIIMSMKISFGNSILTWFGNHVFSVYILQRIPMILLAQTGINQRHKYVYFILVFVLTIFMAQIFDYITDRIWKYNKK